MQDLVYGRKFDYGVKQAAKQGGTAEHVFEQEPVKEAWAKITTELAKEAEERKALCATNEEEQDTEDDVLTAARQPPNTHELHSVGYWRSVANQCVRTYCSLQPEPKTIEGVVSAVSQGNLKDIAGTSGKDCVLTFLCMDSLGESSQGPGAQALLRKKYNVEAPLLRKLVQGSMIARGSQRRESNEATRVVEGDLVAVHAGIGHPGGHKEAKAMFRLSSAKKDADLDSEVKDMLIVFDDESIRNRKQRVRGSYVSHTCMVLASSAPLTQCIPEKAFEQHTGHCTSNVFQGVKALAPTDMWHTSRLGCCVCMCLLNIYLK